MALLRFVPLLVLKLAIISSVSYSTTAISQDSSHSGSGNIVVGTKVAPPFSIKRGDGEWEGISIALFEHIAEKMHLSVEWREKSIVELIEHLESGELDASVAAISVTAGREQRIDFSHPFYNSGLAIATARTSKRGWAAIMKAMMSPEFLFTISLLCAVLFFVGVLMWLLERKRNSEQFEKLPAKGVYSGFWWAAVTMTTVGYGDKSPVTFFGRFVAIIWMFAALILTAIFTAQLSAALTVQGIETSVDGVADLSNVNVGNISDTASNAYFRKYGIPVEGFPTISEGFDALTNGSIDAFVHDEALLKWTATQSGDPVSILPEIFERQYYAIALPQDSRLREQINQTLLEVMRSEEWGALFKRYLGE